MVDANTHALRHVGAAITLGLLLLFVSRSAAADTGAVDAGAAGAVGGAAGVGAVFGGPIRGGARNPARPSGPARVSGNLHSLWLHLVAPICGASLAALAYQFVRGET